MQTAEWANIVRVLRRLHGLTPRQFALMIGTTTEAVGVWEKSLDVPGPFMQAVLRDLLSGHIENHPTFLGVKAMVRATDQLSALYTPGLTVHALSRPLERMFVTHQLEVLGSSMLPKLSGRNGEMAEQYSLPMLEGKSDVLSFSYTDRGVADPSLIVRQQVTVIPLDGLRVLATVGLPLGMSTDSSMPEPDLRLTTADDVRS